MVRAPQAPDFRVISNYPPIRFQFLFLRPVGLGLLALLLLPGRGWGKPLEEHSSAQGEEPIPRVSAHEVVERLESDRAVLPPSQRSFSSSGLSDIDVDQEASPCVPPVIDLDTLWPINGAVEVSASPRFRVGVLNNSGPGILELLVPSGSPFRIVSSYLYGSGNTVEVPVEIGPGTTFRWKARISNRCGVAETGLLTFTTTAGELTVVGDVASGTPQSIAVRDNLAFVATGHYLDVWDLAVPTAPTRLSRYDSGHGCWKVIPNGNFLYLETSGWPHRWFADAMSTQILDISNPAIPLFRSEGTWGLPMAASGNLLVSKGTSWPNFAYIYDISNPVQPVYRASIEIDRDPVLSGTLLLTPASGSDRKSRVWDLSDPAHPTLRFESTASFSRGFASGNWYFGTDSTTFAIWSFADPAHPAKIANAPPPAGPGPIALVGSSLLVWSTSGTQVWDVSNPPIPQLLGTIATANGFGLIGGSGHLAVVSKFGTYQEIPGLGILDVSASPPLELARIAPYGLTTDATITGRTVYEASRYRGLVVHDVSNPAAPREIREISTGNWNIVRLQLDGGRLLVLLETGSPHPTERRVQIFDLSNPRDPVLVGQIDGLPPSAQPQLAGEHVHGVTTDGRYSIWGATGIPAPLLGGTGNDLQASVAMSILVDGDRSYVDLLTAGLGGYQLFDVSTPETPALLPGGMSGYRPSGHLMAKLPGRRLLFATFYCDDYGDLGCWPVDSIAETDSDGQLADWEPFPGGSLYGRLNGYAWNGGNVSVWGNLLFEGGERIAATNLSGSIPKDPIAEIELHYPDHDACGFHPSEDGRLAVAPQIEQSCALFDVSLITHPKPMAVVDLSPSGPLRLCQTSSAAALVDRIRLEAAARLTTGPCQGSWSWKWTENDRPIFGALGASYVTPQNLSTGLHRYRAEARCSDDLRLVATSEEVIVEVAGWPPVEVTGFRIEERFPYDYLTTQWADRSGISEYVILTDSSPSGPFGTIVGRGTSGALGIPVPSPHSSEDAYYVLRAVNGCGTAP
jgi:hypothetical protein